MSNSNRSPHAAIPTHRRSWEQLWRRLDTYTLWAFNPSPLLAPKRPPRPTGSVEHTSAAGSSRLLVDIWGPVS